MTTDPAEIQACIIAWKAKRPPTYPHQFDQLLPILGEGGQASAFHARIRWNPLRDHYEMDPVRLRPNGTEPELVTLELDTAAYRTLQRHLARLGITHSVRVHLAGQAPRTRPTTLPPSLFPTIIGK